MSQDKDLKLSIPTWNIGDKILERYKVFNILGGPGKSGMGIVYVCYDEQFKVPVAIKTFQDRFLKEQEVIDRFRYEAETWIRIGKHKNIVFARYIEEFAGKPLIVVDYITGEQQYGADLDGWIYGNGLYRNGTLDLPLILNFAIQFCHGMIHAKEKFLEMGKIFVHRDIKPQNIMITKDRILKITDFGLVKAFDELKEDVQSTRIKVKNYNRVIFSKEAGYICGTPPYMSPEQCRGERYLTEQSDIYSFGCVMYEMIKRRMLFGDIPAEEYIKKHIRERPKALNIYKELDDVIFKCLEKDPIQRFADFEVLEDKLQGVLKAITGIKLEQPKEEEAEIWELNNKGLSLQRMGLFREAIEPLNKALEIYEGYAAAHNNLGIVYFDLGEFKDAVKQYRRAIEINNDYAEAYNNLGNALYWVGEKTESIKAFKSAIRLNHNYALAYYNLGLTYDREGENEVALENYKKAMELDHFYIDTYNNMGILYQKMNMKLEAEEIFNSALRINPNHAKAHNNLGLLYKGLRELDKAEASFKEALRIDNDYCIAYINLGTVYEEEGQFDQALKQYESAIKRGEKLPQAHNNIGLIYSKQGELEKAEVEFNIAISFKPEYADPFLNLGNVYIKKGLNDLAINEYLKAIEIDDKSAITYGNLGIAYGKQKDTAKALAAFEKAIAIMPNYVSAHYNLGLLYLETGDYQKAVEESELTLSMDPKIFDSYRTIGLALAKQREYKSAIDYLQKYIDLIKPDDKGERIEEINNIIKQIMKTQSEGKAKDKD